MRAIKQVFDPMAEAFGVRHEMDGPYDDIIDYPDLVLLQSAINIAFASFSSLPANW